MKLLKIIVILSVLLLMTITAYAKDGKVQLTWKNAEDAVMYELEIANEPITTNKMASTKQTVYRTTNIFTPGVELDLSLFKKASLKNMYYRVRPITLDKTPITEFYAPVALTKGAFNTKKPKTTTVVSKNHPAPLYPAYSWIPVLGATGYEVEITNRLPENPNGIAASKYRTSVYAITGGFDCYDTHAYTEAGTYYWRVRAVDAEHKPIGTYSDAISFSVNTNHYKWAVFGDSITHGGGAISNPPSDERFEYVSYLPFPVKNLGKSGDTAEMMVERFDAEVLPFKPQYMFVLGGSNSIREGTSAQSVIASLQAIKEKCERNNIIPIFLTLPPVNPERIQRVFDQPTAEGWQNELKKVNAYIRSQKNFVEIYLLLADDQGILPVQYAEDGLHPDISGKKIMGHAINEFLQTHHFQ